MNFFFNYYDVHLPGPQNGRTRRIHIECMHMANTKTMLVTFFSMHWISTFNSIIVYHFFSGCFCLLMSVDSVVHSIMYRKAKKNVMKFYFWINRGIGIEIEMKANPNYVCSLFDIPRTMFTEKTLHSTPFGFVSLHCFDSHFTDTHTVAHTQKRTLFTVLIRWF